MKFEFDWSDIWNLTGYLAVLALGAISLTALCADHRPQGYYLSVQGQMLCVKAVRPWIPDEITFCSTETLKSVEVFVALTAKKEVKELLATPQ